MINSVLLTSSISTLPTIIAIFISILAIILIFFVKVVNQGDVIRQNSHMPNVTIHVPQLKMHKVIIPFTFRLENHKNSNGAVKFVVSSNVKYSLQAFYNVSIRELHMSLWRSCQELRDKIKNPSEYIIDQAYCKQIALDIRNQEPHKERTIVINSNLTKLNLGSAPRLAYPLVVFLIREDETDENPDDTVLLMNVIHLQDSLCPLPTSVLAQYLKQKSGQLSCLKQLYLSAVDNENEYDVPASSLGSLSLAEPVACNSNGERMPILCTDRIIHQPENFEQLCVVCRYYPLSRALLPCRHTVLCAICFSKLDRCPICRSPIASYFCIRSEDYASASNDMRQEPKNKVSINWIDALNDRLTDFLGFR